MTVLCSVLVFWSFTFFRVPTNRKTTIEKDAVVSAADGEVVVIEEVEEKEYFHDKRIQISIFMSAYNVHVNWFPMNGVVSYYKYHPGKKLFAINPKSSELNERNTLVVKDEQGREVLFRQIAGVMARRIICHVDKGATAKVGEEFGLIRFGSRVDFFLTENGAFLNEINTIPGFTPISMYPKMMACIGIPYSSLITKLLLLAEGCEE
jgi:phosphatidylserine decarboxylase